ncbi:MAG: helix-turn-helix transcriptional regulator [Clostridiaceae bacterium]|jgi:putative transcriptional regulator|nr:helix-turn-helix transcriptional regulator [Clostridiaceae bacterium]
MKTRVKEFRTAAKMTQQQLADLVYVSSRTIISIEKEQYNPSLMLAYRMAEVFGVSVEELCCLKENKALEDEKYEDL